MDQKYYVYVQLFSLFRLQSRLQMLRRRVEKQLHDDRQFVFLKQLTQHAKATWPTGLARILEMKLFSLYIKIDGGIETNYRNILLRNNQTQLRKCNFKTGVVQDLCRVVYV